MVKIGEKSPRGRAVIGSFPTAEFYREYIERGERTRINRQKLGLDAGTPIAATGYGKVRFLEDEAFLVPEIRAIALGVMEIVGKQDFLVLDMGGQDIKAILVSGGNVEDFATNDRCAASSGRYLENMASVLGITLEELTGYHDDPVELSSTCAIFGETELVGLMAEGCPLERLAAGVNLAICRRMLPLLARFQSELLVCTGGVARNQALIQFLAEEARLPILVPENPEFVASFGCCVAFQNQEPVNRES
jgi:predicted CoA-substrate-specific enzyme activase